MLLLLGICSACSCAKDGNSATSEENTPAVSLSVTPLSLEFTSEAASADLAVKASSKPKALSNSSWCRASVTPLQDNACTVTVSVEENTGSASREASISILSGSEKVLVSVIQAAPTSVVPEDFLEETKRGDNLAWKMAERLGLGWNMGNQMDSYDNEIANETIWGNKPATEATFKGLKAKGFTSVRIPVTWMGHIGDAPSYTLEQAWLDRVAELVGFAQEAGLNVIVNIHHDGANSEHWLNIKKAAASEAQYKAITEMFTAVWKQIATRFKDKGDFLIFEAFNELHDGGWGWGENRTDGGAQYAVINKWVQEFVTTVRSVGGENATRYLGIPGYCANPDLTMQYLTLPQDSATDRLMVAVHCYDPYDYTLECKYAEWGHTAKNNACPSGEKDVIAVMARLKAAYVDKGIPVYFGETGCSNRDSARETLFQTYYLEFFYKACRNYGIPPFYWDNGSEGAGRESGGIVNHSTGEYVRDGKVIIEAMNRAVFTTSSSYTLRSVYNGAPK